MNRHLDPLRQFPGTRVKDPLGYALLGAILLHAFLILGITFDIQRNNPPAPERTLDIALVKPEKKPLETKKPDFLANASQQGGGEKISKTRPSSPMGNPQARTEQRQPAPELQRAGTPNAEARQKPQVVTTRKARQKQKVATPKPRVEATPRPKVAQLLASTQREIDRLTAELDRRSLAASQQKRRKTINASTQEYKYASYLETWRKKVERIGNLNYPDEAKRKKLYGALILHVAVRRDGSIEQIRLLRSSGHKILDDAAIRIVRLSAPFSAFPPAIRGEVDVLDITRTWQFRSGNQLFSSR